MRKIALRQSSPMQKNDFGFFTLDTKIKWTTYRCKCKATKYLIASIDLNYHDCSVGNSF